MFSQIGLVGDEDDVYLFQCLLQEAVYLGLCNALKCNNTKPFDGSWQFRYPGIVKYITTTVEIT